MPKFSSAVQTLTVRGGTGAGENLQLSSTSHSSKGKILLGSTSAFDEVTGRLGIGTLTPAQPLDVAGNAAFSGNATVGGGLTVGGNLTVTGIGQMLFVRKPASQARNSTTVIAADGLVFNALANATYLISLRASFDSPTATDVKVNWTAPGDAFMQRYILAPAQSLTANNDTNVTMIRREAGTAQQGGGGGAGTFTTWWEDVLLVTTSAGAIQPQFGSVSTGSTTMHSDSLIYAVRVA